MIPGVLRAYPDKPSVRAGDTVALCVSTDEEAFHVWLLRCGTTLSRCADWGPWPGHHRPPGPVDQPWDWPPYPLPIPADARPGVHVAVLTPCRGGDHAQCRPSAEIAVDARQARALLVVRPGPGSAPATFLYKVPLFTYQAYNASGGGSLYVRPAVDPVTARSRVTFLRPGGGTGGDLSFPSGVDVYDPSTPREGFAHWDHPCIAWLEGHGYDVDYCTDLDLHADATILAGHRALLSAGHDEYWSAQTREAIERFVVAGGHLVLLSGNTCFWRVEVDGHAATMSCRHPPTLTADADQWWHSRPEQELTGVSYRHGGGWWSGPREALGYTVAHAGHWAYAGTGVVDGDHFGAASRLVGYECDGVALADAPGGVRPVGAAGGAGDLVVLASAALGPGWQDRADGDGARAVMGLRAPNGLVFTASTTDWPRVLSAGEPVVEGVTRNVLARCSVPPVRLHGPDAAEAGSDVDLWVRAETGAAVSWDSSGGELRADGPTAVLRLPPRPGPVTVWALISPPVGPEAFATRTLWVLAPSAAAQIRLLEAIRRLVAATPPYPVSVLPSEAGNRALLDERWDSLGDGLRRAITVEEADDLAALARAVSAAAEALADRLAGGRATVGGGKGNQSDGTVGR